MNGIKTETKTNGYKASSLQGMIAIFEAAAAQVFPGCTVSHFYYGDHLDMADLKIDDDHNYGHFDIRQDSVRLNGHTCMEEDLERLGSLTYHDELYESKLMELAGH